MKKSLVLTAIAATLAAPAFAQSSVTIYGRLNVSIESYKVDGASKRDWQEVDNSSRIGFAGEEDLGGGNKAIFKIEHGFDARPAPSMALRFWARESTVGLADPLRYPEAGQPRQQRGLPRHRRLRVLGQPRHRHHR
jgi:predicted porin